MHEKPVSVTIDGEPRPLRLTLGALAEIEAAFGGDFAAFKERLKNPRVADIIVILHALVGGGGARIALEALKASDIDFAEASRAIAETFAALREDGAELGEDGAAAPGKPQAPATPPAGSPGAHGSSTP